MFSHPFPHLESQLTHARESKAEATTKLKLATASHATAKEKTQTFINLREEKEQRLSALQKLTDIAPLTEAEHTEKCEIELVIAQLQKKIQQARQDEDDHFDAIRIQQANIASAEASLVELEKKTRIVEMAEAIREHERQIVKTYNDMTKLLAETNTTRFNPFFYKMSADFMSMLQRLGQRL
ncbi:hypothetical protein ACVOZ6_004678 [Escherichia coli]